jgi:phosphoribosyl 1,2-cyclic phosphate phosphodiesterase
MDITFLGTGTSHGIPVVGCPCAVCRSKDGRDTRWRSSILVRALSGENLLVDSGPEFRLQALRAGILRLDAVFLTHAHADHLHGLDDLRPLTRRSPLPVYGNAEGIAELKERFSYVFRDTQRGGGKPSLMPVVIGTTVMVGKVLIQPIPVKHGELDILGWKFTADGASAAYLTDASRLGEEALGALRNLDLLVLGALRVRPHATHMSFAEAAEIVRAAAPKTAFVTHLCHDQSPVEAEACFRGLGIRCGDGRALQPAWDGLNVTL